MKKQRHHYQSKNIIEMHKHKANSPTQLTTRELQASPPSEMMIAHGGLNTLLLNESPVDTWSTGGSNGNAVPTGITPWLIKKLAYCTNLCSRAEARIDSCLSSGAKVHSLVSWVSAKQKRHLGISGARPVKASLYSQSLPNPESADLLPGV